MTFTEAAVEVLRRAGKPLHYKDIAESAIRENLLSHVGQDPEVTMGQRLAAMARREEERKVVAIAPEGMFALTEWSVPADLVVEPIAPPLHPEESGEAQYRPREREPRPIHAQARRRMEQLQAEHEEGSGEVEQERRRRDGRPEKGQRRYPPPAEVVFEALAQRQTGAPLAELAQALLQKQLLSEGLVQDLPSLVAALLEDNRRRTEVGRKPAFIVDGERVTLVEFPPPAAAPEVPERAPQTALGRPMSGAQLAAEGRRAVVRALRRRLAELETAGFEHLCAALLEKMGMRDVRVAKRSKEGPLYLARQKRGLSDLRVAVKLVRGAREIGRGDVQELRKDLAHYSAQMGLVLAAGEAGREARSEASAAGQPPVALYAGDALPEELIALRIGVTVQLVEVADVDEAFFASASRAAPGQHAREEERGKREPREKREHRGEGDRGEAEPRAAAEPGAAAEAEAPAPAAAEAAPAQQEQPAAPAPAEPAVAAPETAAADDRQRGRKRRDERPRAMTPADQAWGQPAGTLRQPQHTGLAIAMGQRTLEEDFGAAGQGEAPPARAEAPQAEAPQADVASAGESPQGLDAPGLPLAGSSEPAAQPPPPPPDDGPGQS